MRRSIIAFVSLLTALGHASKTAAEPATFTLDPTHLGIAFKVHHIGYAATLGQFLKAEGSFAFDEQAKALSDVDVRIDAKSVFSNHDKRDAHVVGADFLDTGNHPEIRFASTGAHALSETTGTVDGDLTIRGVTRPVTLNVTMNKIGPYPFGNNYVVGVSADTSINRSDFGITYAVENGWVGDRVDITIEFEAIRQ